MGLFRRSGSAPVPKSGFRPALESLAARDVPAILAVDSSQLAGGLLVVRTNLQNDRVTVRDNGTATGRSVVFETQQSDGTWARENTTASQNVQNFFAAGFVTRLRVVDEGSINLGNGNDRNFVTVDLNASAPTLGTVEFVGADNWLAGRDEFVVRVNQGLSKNLQVTAAGGPGNDLLRVDLRGTVRRGATLQVDASGGRGRDSIGLDAWGSPTIESGATVRANLSGYARGQMNGDAGGDDVSVWYLGEMDGRLVFNLEGSGGVDSVGVHLWTTSGSTGTVGDDTFTGARVAAGNGNDGVEYVVNGGAAAGAEGVKFPFSVVDGGDGYDTLYVAQRTNPQFKFAAWPTQAEGLVFVPY